MPRRRVLFPCVVAALAVVAGVAPAVAAGPGGYPDLTLGAAGAPVTVVEYLSPTCLHCIYFQAEVFPALKSKYLDPGKVRFIVHELPVHVSQDTSVFLLAHCVGPRGYWKVINQVMEEPDNSVYGDPVRFRQVLVRIAGDHGLSEARAAACLDDAQAARQIQDRLWRDVNGGGIKGAPTFVVNGAAMSTTTEPSLAAFDAVLGPLLAGGAGRP